MEVDTQESKITYPPSLTEPELNITIATIIDGIDRDILLQDERLIRIRHPLLHDRVSKQITINYEIYKILYTIVNALIVPYANCESDLLLLENSIIAASKMPDQMRLTLLKFYVQITQLENVDSNSAKIILEHLSTIIKGKFAMPTTIQNLLLYPPVTEDALGKGTDEILATLKLCKKKLLAALTIDNTDPEGLFAEAVENEAAIIKEWFQTRKSTP